MIKEAYARPSLVKAEVSQTDLITAGKGNGNMWWYVKWALYRKRKIWVHEHTGINAGTDSDNHEMITEEHTPEDCQNSVKAFRGNVCLLQ